MIGTWLDFSAGRPGAAAIKAAGHIGVIRYVGLGSGSKLMTVDEYQDYVRNGVQVGLVAEYDTHDAEHGYATGQANGRIAVDSARSLGVPDSVPIFCAGDEHLYGNTIQVGVEYARGFQDSVGHGRAGCYGFSEFIQACQQAGVGSFYWQCGSHSMVGPRVHFWQNNNETTVVNGIDCDINEQYLPIGVNEVELGTQYTDWAGNQQTVQSTFDNNDKRTYALADQQYQSRYVDPTGKQSDYKDTLPGYILNIDNATYATRQDLGVLKQAVADLAAKVQAPQLTDAQLETIAAKTAQHLAAIQFKAQ